MIFSSQLFHEGSTWRVLSCNKCCLVGFRTDWTMNSRMSGINIYYQEGWHRYFGFSHLQASQPEQNRFSGDPIRWVYPESWHHSNLIGISEVLRTITSNLGAISRSWSVRDISNWDSSLTWKNQLTSSLPKGTLRSNLSSSSRWEFKRPSSSSASCGRFTRPMSLGVGVSCFFLVS